MVKPIASSSPARPRRWGHIHEIGAPSLAIRTSIGLFVAEGDKPTVGPTTGSTSRRTKAVCSRAMRSTSGPERSEAVHHLQQRDDLSQNNVEFPAGSRLLELGAYLPTPGYVVNYSSIQISIKMHLPERSDSACPFTALPTRYRPGTFATISTWMVHGVRSALRL